ncbi:hypothetical protein VPH35_138743 [Triticum aestivum]
MLKKKKLGGGDFSPLSRHGCSGRPSILIVAPPKKEVLTKSFEEGERTRAAVTEGEKLIGVMNPQPRRAGKQKEKRKRDRGQANRGKNYAEEEKRLLRGSGVYSGFDT